MKSNIDPEYLLQVRKEIGSQIREMRLQKGLSIRDLAIEVGVRYPTIIQIEHGRWSFGIDAIIALAIKLGFHISLTKNIKDQDLLQAIRQERTSLPHSEVFASPDPQE